MYKPIEVDKNIYYVGANDRTKHLFENLWPLPNGVSYNSYLIVDEKVVLIDTVDKSFSDTFLRKTEAILGDKTIDYLIVNHMEPDHSGSVGLLVNKYPDIKLVGNKRTVDMIKGYHGISKNLIEVVDMEVLDIGENKLHFYLTPMVHWPETMMTYLPERRILFSGDAFGTFGALDGAVVDTHIRFEKYKDEMIRYYSNIVGKFGTAVQTALKKLSNVDIDIICSTHGPIWSKNGNMGEVVSLYDKLSKYEADNGLVIVYGSMYGNTGELAEIIADSASRNGVKDIVVHNASKSHESDIIRDIFKYRGLIIGSPTYNSKLYPAVASVVQALQNRNLKNRLFGYFGGHTWSDASERLLKSFAEKMSFDVVADAVVLKQGMLSEVYEKAYDLGEIMANKLINVNNE